MEEGFTVDHAQSGVAVQQVWAEGEPARSIWTGLKLKGREQYSVRTYRCTSCGFLESYAVEAAPGCSIL